MSALVGVAGKAPNHAVEPTGLKSRGGFYPAAYRFTLGWLLTMTKNEGKIVALASLAGAILAIMIGGSRSVMNSYLFEYSDEVTPIDLLEWAFLGAALGLLFSPSAAPDCFHSPRLCQTLAGTVVGLALALIFYGGGLSLVVGAFVGAGIGFFARLWEPHI